MDGLNCIHNSLGKEFAEFTKKQEENIENIANALTLMIFQLISMLNVIVPMQFIGPMPLTSSNFHRRTSFIE